MGYRIDIRSWSVFVEQRTASPSSMKGKQFGTPYVIPVKRYFPEARKNQLDWVIRQSLTLRGCGNCEGRTVDKELHGARS